jgi:hypothetical protein
MAQNDQSPFFWWFPTQHDHFSGPKQVSQTGEPCHHVWSGDSRGVTMPVFFWGVLSMGITGCDIVIKCYKWIQTLIYIYIYIYIYIQYIYIIGITQKKFNASGGALRSTWHRFRGSRRGTQALRAELWATALGLQIHWFVPLKNVVNLNVPYHCAILQILW